MTFPRAHSLDTHHLGNRLFPFVFFQAAYAALFGFAFMLQVEQHSISGLVNAILDMFAVTALCFVGVFGLARYATLNTKLVASISLAIPAFILLIAPNDPGGWCVSLGFFMGLGWCTRHSLELGLLKDQERDYYASRVVPISVIGSFSASFLMAYLLDQQNQSYSLIAYSFAVIAILGAVIAFWYVPSYPLLAITAPVAILRQPTFIRILPIYLLESGLLGISMLVMGSASQQAIGIPSHLGWLNSMATLLGAVVLFGLRYQRHSHNRVYWMGLACVGMMLAYLALGLSVPWAWLYVVYVLLLAVMKPFWDASEQVLNQRAMDFTGSLADRIVVREVVLGLMRCGNLWLFWLLMQHSSAQMVVAFGAVLMATALGAEFYLGRHWLESSPSEE